MSVNTLKIHLDRVNVKIHEPNTNDSVEPTTPMHLYQPHWTKPYPEENCQTNYKPITTYV